MVRLSLIHISPDDTEVTIKSILYESFVCVKIIDNGIGIPEQEQGKVFQRFYRGTNVTDKPVSYTHLDVYKRQTPRCTCRNSSFLYFLSVCCYELICASNQRSGQIIKRCV